MHQLDGKRQQSDMIIPSSRYLVLAALHAAIGCSEQPALPPAAPPIAVNSEPVQQSPDTEPVASAAVDCGPFVDGVDFHFQATIPAASEETDLSMTCGDVLDVATSDWAGAHTKLSGRRMTVRGVVAGTRYTLDGLECVQLKDDDPTSEMVLECIVESGSWLNCRAGNAATISGHWDRYALAPRLLHAQIVEVTGDSTAVEMAAEDFLKLIAADFEGARGGFHEQQFILQGTIRAIEPHIPPIEGVTAENAANATLQIAESNGFVLELLAADRPGAYVFASRRLQVGDQIVASFPIRDLADHRFGGDRIIVGNAMIALHDDPAAGSFAAPDKLGTNPAAEPVYRMTSAEFTSMCEQHQSEKRTLISPAEFEITGTLHRLDPFMSLNIRLDDGLGHVRGVKCYLQTGGNWTVALPGQTVTVRGRLFPLGSVIDSLLDCRIVKVSGCPHVYSISELVDLVSGSGRVDSELHMLGVVVKGVLSGTSADDWQLRQEGTADGGAVRVEFGSEFHPSGGSANKQITISGKVMRTNDHEFYLNDCMLLPDAL